MEIIIRLRSKLDAMLFEAYPPKGDLMEKVLDYFYTFWTQLFLYTKDGFYTIDNFISFIRFLSGELKASLLFGSDRRGKVLPTYFRLVITCIYENRNYDFTPS